MQGSKSRLTTVISGIWFFVVGISLSLSLDSLAGEPIVSGDSPPVNSSFLSAPTRLPAWQLWLSEKYELDFIAVSRTSETLCLDLRPLYGEGKQQVGVQDTGLNQYSAGKLNKSSECLHNSNSLRFAVRIVSSVESGDYRILYEADRLNLQGGFFRDLPWRLQRAEGNLWEDVGGYKLDGRFGFSKSRWLKQNDLYILEVVDEKARPVVEVVRSAEKNTENSRDKSSDAANAANQNHERSRAIRFSNIKRLTENKLDSEAFRSNKQDIPTYHGDFPRVSLRNGEAGKDIFLQVVRQASEPAIGMTCLRLVYFSGSEQIKYFVRTTRNTYRSTDNSYPIDSKPMRSCVTGNFLAFPAFINVNTQRQRTRFYALAPKSSEFYLNEMSLKLVGINNSRRVFATLTGRIYGQGKSSWFTDGQGQFGAYLSDDRKARDQQVNLTLISKNSGTEKTSYFIGGGRPLGKDNSLLLTNEKDRLIQIGLDRRDLPAVVRVCVDMNCLEKSSVSELSLPGNPFTLSLQDIPPALRARENLYLIIDWHYKNSASPTIADSAANGSTSLQAYSPSKSSRKVKADLNRAVEIKFKPTVALGNYSKALTSCLGRLVDHGSGQSISKAFSLKKDGIQSVLVDRHMMARIEPDTPIKVLYGRGRRGGDCPIQGMVSDPVRFGDMVQRGYRNQVVLHNFLINGTVFTGYLHLGRKKLNQSRARWNEFLVFFDKVYQLGRSKGAWLEGEMIGRKKRAVYDTILESSNNFSNRIADRSALDSLAGDLVANGLPNKYFDEFLEKFSSKVGTTKVNLVYYDGQAESCDEYQAELDQQSADIEFSIVLAGLSDYSPTNYELSRSLDHDDLVGVCVQSDNLVVYAFNASDVEGNRQWGILFDVVLEDLEGIL